MFNSFRLWLTIAHSLCAVWSWHTVIAMIVIANEIRATYSPDVIARAHVALGPSVGAVAVAVFMTTTAVLMWGCEIRRAEW